MRQLKCSGMKTLTAIQLSTGTGSIVSVEVTDESEALGQICFSVLRQEYSCDFSKSLEEIAKLLFLGQLGDLKRVELR